MVKDIANQLIGDIRSKLSSELVSNPYFTDKFLIRCFRCMHYDERKTIKLIENYEKTLNQLSSLRTKYQLLDFIETGIFKILTAKGLNDETILYFDLKKWKPRSILFKHVVTTLAIMLDYLMLDENAEKSGIILLINFENFGLHRLLSIRKPFVSKFIKVIDGHLPFHIKSVLVINLNLTGRFFFSTVIHLFDKDLLDKLKLFGKDLADMKNYLDERALSIQFADANKQELEVDFKQEFADKAFTFFGYRYEDD